MRFDKLAVIVLSLLTMMTACDKSTDIQLSDRKQVNTSFRLQAVLSGQDTLEQYAYDGQQRMLWAQVRSADRYVFNYAADGTLSGMNNIRFIYQASQLARIEGPRTITEIQYPDANRVILRQTRFPLIPKQPAVKDTLVLFRNQDGHISRATLSPAGNVSSFSYDNNPIAYTNITTYLLPVLLQYPVEEILPSLAALFSGHNLLRYNKGPGITAGDIPVMNTTDYSYRFDQLLFDVPTMQEQHSTTTVKFYFLYH